MNIFYNEKGIGDVLMLTKEKLSGERRTVDQSGDVVQIINKENGEIVGINILNASTYGNVSGNGAIDLDSEVKQLVSTAFEKSGKELAFNLEQTPTFVIGYVESKDKHPNADKLSVCQVNVGDSSLQIVCGAPNVEAGQKVVVALVGAVMPSGLTIKDAKLRGVDSSGMICSAMELGIENASTEKGIFVLPETAEIGTAFQGNN